MQRLIDKTATMMRRLDNSIPDDIAARCNIFFRDEFFGDGYARPNAATDRAIMIAQRELGLTLDTTYAGKAMATLLHDASQETPTEEQVLFWNTYNSRALPVTAERPDDTSQLPEEFLRYYD
jgi:1-aminocyclopropane-1-carboxylate deaminase/D-cysteine desulfhydrase-like pyridoxal-dependent ACC family enzyme